MKDCPPAQPALAVKIVLIVMPQFLPRDLPRRRRLGRGHAKVDEMLDEAPDDVRVFVRFARFALFAAHEIGRLFGGEARGSETLGLHHRCQTADQDAVGLDRPWCVIPCSEMALERLDEASRQVARWTSTTLPWLFIGLLPLV